MRAAWQKAGISARMERLIHSTFVHGVKFSDGEVCDAYAIKANFDAIIENKDRHTWLEMMNLLVGVSAPDDKYFCDRAV